ncbi:MAG: ABC transporter permease [Planctomycetota bacterium]|nr:ABC transporter permease [Planctomycetota bacterium]
MSEPQAQTPPAMTGGSQSYWDLVWGQFRKNRLALVSLVVIAVLFVLAAWAPVLAEGKPWVWREDGRTSYPLPAWLTAPTSGMSVDYLFNYFFFLTLTVPAAVLLVRRSMRGKEFSAKVARKRWSLGLLAAVLAGVVPFIGPGSYERGATPAEKEAQPELQIVKVWHFFRRYRLDNRDYLGARESLSKERGDYAYFPLVAQDPLGQTTDLLQPPSSKHFLGTDNQGRDVLARMLHGGRISLSVGFVAVGIATLIGILIGGIAGYYRGWVDIAISRFIEVVICFPTFFLIITIIAFIDERSIFHVMLVIGLTGWTGLARLVRGEFLKLADQDFVHAARALGCGGARIMFRHILPNAMAPVLVSVAFAVAGAVLTESGLSYLGFGAPPPTPTWGELISQGKTHIFEGAWWLLYFPGFMIFLSVTVYNLAGDGLRDAMDPRMRN